MSFTGEREIDAGSILYTHNVEMRIRYLDGLYARTEDSAEWEDEHSDEYAALMTFRDECVGQWGQKAWDEGLSLVADSHWTTYAAQTAHDIYGEATETGFWDDDQWAEAAQGGYMSVTYNGEEYWGNGQA
jgi:hypothetical protein